MLIFQAVAAVFRWLGENLDTIGLVLISGLGLAAAGFVGFAYYAWFHDAVQTSENRVAKWLGQSLGIRQPPRTTRPTRAAEAARPGIPANEPIDDADGGGGSPALASAHRPRIPAVARRRHTG